MKGRRIVKSALCTLLTLALLLDLLPAAAFSASDTGRSAAPDDGMYVFTEADNALIDEDVFALIAEVEDKTIVPRRGKAPTPEDFVKILPQVIEAVEASETYVEGSLVRNGDFIWWRASNGMACAYHPYMEAIHHGWQDPELARESEDEAALAELLDDVKAKPATRSVTPGSTNVALVTPYWDNSDSEAGYLDKNFCKNDPSFKELWLELCVATGSTMSYRYTLANASVNNIAKCIEDCSLVILHSHGATDCWYRGTNFQEDKANSSYIFLTTQDGLTSEDMQANDGVNQHVSYCHAYKCSNGESMVDGTCIANHMEKAATDSFVYLGMCYGMATNGLCAPLRAKGVRAVLGFSRPVTFIGDMEYAEALFPGLREGKTLAAALSEAKEICGDWDPVYNDKTLEWAQKNDKAFPIVVSQQDAYPGKNSVQNLQTVNSTWRLLDPELMLTGSVTVTPAIPWYGDKMSYLLSGRAYDLQQSGVAISNAWQRSDDGETGWTTFTAGPHTAGINDIGKYLRVRITASGYDGVLYSSPVLVTKAVCTDPVAKPQLWGSGTNISVTNSRSDQEYFVLNYKKDVANLTASDWAAAKSGNDGSLTLSGTANSVNYVYTRLKETDTTFSGIVVVMSNIYLGESASLQNISLSYELLDSNGNPKELELEEMGVYYYAEAGDVIKVTAEPVPSNVTFNGIRGSNWHSTPSDMSYGRYYTSSGCYEPIYSDQYYKTVYFKLEKPINHLMLSAEYTKGYNDIAYDSASFIVGDSSGEYLFDSASASVTVYVGGAVKDYPIKRIPDRADLTGATIGYSNGTGTNPPTVTLSGNTVSVDASNATGGYYDFAISKNGVKLAGGVNVHVTTPPVEEFSLSPTKLTVHPGRNYTLKPVFLPAASETEITWTSSNTNVATVIKGVVTVKYYADIGETATITATVGDKSATCELTVFGDKFDLEVDGVQVTTKNLDDILGNGVFSFDGRDTLTVSGSYSTDGTVINNYGVDNFTINVEKDAMLTSNKNEAIIVGEDTTIRGAGKLTLYAPKECGIYVTDLDTTLTLQNITINAEGRWGIAGPNDNNSTKLVIDHSAVTATAADGAICDFGGGITIRNSEIVKPQGGRISSEGKDITDSAGTVSNDVQIDQTIPAESPFTDVEEGKYYFTPVLWAFYHDPQVTNGTDAAHFSPDATCTRGQVVTFLWRAAGCPEPSGGGNPFADVKSGAFYYKAVLWAVEKGVTNGTSPTTFSPDQGCTRGQVVTFLHRFSDAPEPGGSANPFGDVKDSAYYYKAVLWAVNHDPQITNGTAAAHFSPDATCTRGQIVTFLYRAMN